MTEEVKDKVRSLYEGFTEKVRNVIQVFTNEFGEELVDNNLVTFEEFLESFSEDTLGSFGISRLSDSNSFGSYTIDSEDYETNGRGKSLLEYIPDLGILDYLKPQFSTRLQTLQTDKTDQNDSEYVFIVIRFPKVTVTNEFDKSIDISELYVRVTVYFDGLTAGVFTMNRAEYTPIQWVDDYAHSHLSGIDRSHPERFRTPCTGSGPVNRTIATLERRYDLNIWGLYAFEIAKYVTVESISGVPYRRLENIGRSNNIEEVSSIISVRFLRNYSSDVYTPDEIKGFLKEFIACDPISIAYKDSNFVLGESFTDFWIRLSNAFIKWHNNKVLEEDKDIPLRRLINSGLLRKYIVAGGIVYSPGASDSMTQIIHYEGKDLFMFKGNMVKLHFSGNSSDNINVTYLVDKELCYYVITRVLEIISYNYGRREERGEEDNTPVSAKCFYA